MTSFNPTGECERSTWDRAKEGKTYTDEPTHSTRLLCVRSPLIYLTSTSNKTRSSTSKYFNPANRRSYGQRFKDEDERRG